MLRVLLAAPVFAITACSSGGTEPPQAANITRVGGDQQDGVVNAQLTVPLSVRVTDAGGGPRAGVTVTWTVISGGGSVSPTSSLTDGDGVAQTTWTLGPLAGEQTVTASVGSATTTFTATAGSCDATVTLGAGSFCVATPARVANMQVSGGTLGAEYMAVVHRYNNLARSPTPVTAQALGAAGVIGPPLPSMQPVAGLISLAGAAVAPDLAFERELRRRERATLPQLVRRGGGAAPAAAFSVEPAPARQLVVGETLTLNTNATGTCTTPRVDRQGVVRAMSANAALVEDTGNPAGGFNDADRAEILAAFETHIRPTVTAAFGNHTDIDGNGRVLLFYTIKVNELTPASQPTSYVGGFFFSRDIFPRTSDVTTPTNVRLGACASSNAAEILYLLAPDPNAAHGAQRTTQFVKTVTPGTIAHELQHLINASKRLYITPSATFPEVVWLDEGLSHIAEELTFYSAAGLTSRSDLTHAMITSTPQRAAARESYMVANLSRFSSFLRTPVTQSPWGETSSTATTPPADWDDLETRGAIWSFLRWAADQRGSSDGTAWRDLSNVQVGLDNLRTIFGADIAAQFREWAVANYTDNTPAPPAGARFQHPSWNFRDALRAISGNNNQFPLATFNIANNSVNFTLAEGGAAYLRFGVPPTGTATVSIRSVGANLPAGTAVWLVRTK